MADGTPRHPKLSVNPGKKANSGNPVIRPWRTAVGECRPARKASGRLGRLPALGKPTKPIRKILFAGCCAARHERPGRSRAAGERDDLAPFPLMRMHGYPAAETREQDARADGFGQ
jgi:hypothetical protein